MAKRSAYARRPGVTVAAMSGAAMSGAAMSGAATSSAATQDGYYDSNIEVLLILFTEL